MQKRSAKKQCLHYSLRHYSNILSHAFPPLRRCKAKVFEPAQTFIGRDLVQHLHCPTTARVRHIRDGWRAFALIVLQHATCSGLKLQNGQGKESPLPFVGSTGGYDILEVSHKMMHLRVLYALDHQPIRCSLPFSYRCWYTSILCSTKKKL